MHAFTVERGPTTLGSVLKFWDPKIRQHGMTYKGDDILKGPSYSSTMSRSMRDLSKVRRWWGWGQSLRARGGDGGQVCGDGDRNHGDGWGWGRVLVPVQLSNRHSTAVSAEERIVPVSLDFRLRVDRC